LKNLIVRAAASVFVALAFCTSTPAAEPIEVFRTGDELIVRLDRFDLLRQANPGLSAELKLRGEGKEKDLLIDLSDAAVNGTLVIDLSKFGNCSALSVTVKDAVGKSIVAKTASPIVEAPVKSGFPASATGPFAFIEPGTAVSAAPAGASAPKIQLPDPKQLRAVRIDPPKRSLSKQEITFPVMTEGEAPLRGGWVLSRQTAAPKDATKASLYISYKKALYEGAKLARWQKFLVEVPIQESWGNGQGDETVNLGNDVQVHVASEVKEKDWRGVQRNILGEGDDDLGQTLSAIDDEGRIYFIAEYRVVRFDPNTKKFEISPPFELQKLCPGGDVMKGSPGWLSGIWTMVCGHGRVFIVDILDFKTGPNPGATPQRRIGGVFSISQDWRDAQAFAADVRLHVGTWESATPTLYKTSPIIGAAADGSLADLITALSKTPSLKSMKLQMNAKMSLKIPGHPKDLYAAKLSDLTPFAQFPALTTLILNGVIIPEGGLASFAKIASLKTLRFENSNIPESEVSALKKLRPELIVTVAK
jgi:hypothetical protein